MKPSAETIAENFLKKRWSASKEVRINPCDSPSSLDDAYAIQNKWREHALYATVGAWKLGGSNKTTQLLFNTTDVYYGSCLLYTSPSPRD